MRFERSAVETRAFQMLWAAALALPMAFGPVAPAAAATIGSLAPPAMPADTTVLAPPGSRISISANLFDNAGVGAEITAAEFATTEYYNEHQIVDGVLYVEAKSSGELNAMASPPAAIFDVDVTVTMTNARGTTASGTVTFRTVYDRAAALPPPPPPPPVFSQTETRVAPAGLLLSVIPAWTFDNAGTNPRITDAVFSTTEYHTDRYTARGVLFLRTKTAAQLNAMTPPPPSPFTVDVTVTMTNDEGQTASGTITFRTDWTPPPPPPPPAFRDPGTVAAAPGAALTYRAEDLFDNAGTNPRIANAEFATTEYYSTHSVQNGVLHVQSKTAAELAALETPPSNPFTVDVTVTMTNDEEQEASGTVTFETTYDVTDTGSAPIHLDGATGGPARIDQ
ncbi:MAG: hypothetical protein OXN81_10170 [Alphaproteobacteria bacterium]|nr:hypothetical protein [Alphaproteobacteria bacterium]